MRNNYFYGNCPICNSIDLVKLTFSPSRCMRSDGLSLDEPLLKYHCCSCGLLIGKNSQSNIPYLRSNGQSSFESIRHKAVAKGLHAHIKQHFNLLDLRVLEIGAASFMTALSLKEIEPNYSITALELNPENIPQTNQIEIVVSDFFKLEKEKFDVCYSNQVIEHFEDPIAFLKKSSQLIKDDGICIVCCPTFVNIGNELLFSDHLFHFTREAISICSEFTDLTLIFDSVSNWDPMSHIYILKKTKSPIKKILNKYPNLKNKRQKLLSDWESEDARWKHKLLNINSITLFGAGEFSQLICTYLPSIWSKVEKIVVDDLSGVRAFNKPIFNINKINLTQNEIFLIGTNQSSHDTVFNNLIDRKIQPNNIFKLSV